MFRRILVTLDGTAFSEAALPAAVGFARKCAAQLRILSVDDSGSAKAYLERTRERLEPIHPDVTISVREGFVPDEILREARDFESDLIVMATHGREAFSRLWLGSVADECVRRAAQPLLLVRPRELGIPPLNGALAVRRVVVPLDGSELAERALPTGMAIADLFGSPIALVRVVQEHAMFESDRLPESHRTNVQMLEDARVGAAAYLRRIADWVCEGRATTIDVRVDDYAARGVLEGAAGDLIVMATHARTGLNRALRGSVADAVVRSATGPVLVMPPEPGLIGTADRHTARLSHYTVTST
jgi:nucleotide-binding universal stress UspA family protein